MTIDTNPTPVPAKHPMPIPSTHEQIRALRQELEVMLLDAMINIAREVTARREEAGPERHRVTSSDPIPDAHN